MAHLDHTFGIEIEFYLPENTTRQQAADAVSARLGVAFGCREENYNHNTRTWWKLVTDGSLNDYVRGTEAVSPVLHGEDGLRQIDAVMGALSDFGCTVSRLCGIHVHVGVGPNPSMDFFKNIFKLYAHFEPVIDRFMPASRRLSSNLYIRSMTNVALTAVERATDLASLIRLTTPHANERRYHKLNLDSYSKHRTVEFRQHSGTLDATKARHWTELCLRMVDAAKAGRSIAASDAAPRNMARRGSKAEQVGNMMLRPQGVTRTEAMAALGWPAISLPQQARSCGLAYTTQRTGHEVRYFAQAAAVTTNAVPATLNGMFDMLDCPEPDRTYFRNRTTNLSGNVQWAA